MLPRVGGARAHSQVLRKRSLTRPRPSGGCHCGSQVGQSGALRRKGRREARARASCPLTPQLTLSDTFASPDTSTPPAPVFSGPQVLEAICSALSKTTFSWGHADSAPPGKGVVREGLVICTGAPSLLPGPPELPSSPMPSFPTPQAHPHAAGPSPGRRLTDRGPGGMVSLIYKGGCL